MRKDSLSARVSLLRFANDTISKQNHLSAPEGTQCKHRIAPICSSVAMAIPLLNTLILRAPPSVCPILIDEALSRSTNCLRCEGRSRNCYCTPPSSLCGHDCCAWICTVIWSLQPLLGTMSSSRIISVDIDS